MKVLIVCNNAFYRGNGLCTAILNLRERLVNEGIDARIMTCPNPDPDGPQPDFPLKHFKFPFFEKIIYSNGFRYAGADRKVMKKAIEWADVIHLEEGFPIEAITASMAAKMGKPCVGSYHLFTENILANLGMRHDRVLNNLVNYFWRKTVYDKCHSVHCPTETVREYLLSHGFKSKLKVVSNGIPMRQDSLPLAPRETNPYLILCTGRLSNEKQQVTLLEAMKHSRHAAEIQLHFAGKGPKEQKYRKIAGKLFRSGVLKYEPKFGFYDSAVLTEICRRAYLYIHCAWVEVEGLSCVEALREGAVPVIASGPFTATAQFALDERSIFPEGDSRKLAELIDWWIEHPEEREAMGVKYAESVYRYNLKDSIAAMIQMYREAIG